MNKIISKIFPFIKPYKSHVISNVIFNVLYALFSTLSFIMLIPMMNVLFDKTKKVDTAPVWKDIFHITDYAQNLLYYNITQLTENNNTETALLIVVSLIITTFLLKNLFGYLASFHMMHLKNGVLRDLRKVMYDKIIALPVSYYSEKRKGDVLARMLGDIGEVQNSFFSILELIVKEPMTIVFSIIGMFAFSFKLTLFVFIFIPICGLIISKIGKSLKARSLEAQKESGRMISIVEESLSGLKIVKSYNAEPHFTGRLQDSINRLLRLSNKIGKKNNLASPLSEFMGIITIAVLLWYGGSMVLVDKTLDGATFLAYMGLAYNILTPAKAISKASYAVKNGVAAAERVFEVLEVENEITDKTNAIEKSTFDDKITIENIDFRYETENVLTNFSLEVPKGKTVALVGQSGSGKSTIANLLTRFYDVQQGSIKVDGIDIKDMKMHSLRNL
ncbi:MAG TPA: ABC transporter ATP-binding protein, partial [Flavobacterium sp.]|uniref:ABC transporter ATP-binding protein n=1 Tax=Flavobacterium sp. TaxID=239 RepID=UPI002C77140A